MQDERLNLSPKSTTALITFVGSAGAVALVAYFLHPFLVQSVVDIFGLQKSGGGMLDFNKVRCLDFPFQRKKLFFHLVRTHDGLTVPASERRADRHRRA